MEMSEKKAIEVIKENCYVFNPMNFDMTTLINTALDRAVAALKFIDEYGENITKYMKYCENDAKQRLKREGNYRMNAEQIIFIKLRRVMAMGPIVAKSDLERLAHDAVEEIRDEFRKAGVDVWPRWKGGET